MPQDDMTPQASLLSAIENLALLTQHAAAIATYKRAMYLEYVSVGFSESQALELVKGLF
jgi:hypothetical protein